MWIKVEQSGCQWWIIYDFTFMLFYWPFISVVISVLIGEYPHNIDSKGRIIVPSKLRESLGDKFVVTKGLDNCLFVYPIIRWESIVEKLKTLPWTNSDVRRFARFFTSSACECEIDSQGRILIPPNLRNYAGLEKQIVSIGVVDRVEIWSKDRWESYNNDENFVDNCLAEKMAELGI